ncbi:hypothetical protein [Mitsuokella sp. WILCCON 0060]|uniref:hypothetical protein n=1 Tax=Mitsuokella sp. WILCCON 0060 TaxID=3345341 RepID=UPI003F1AE715
MNNDKNQEVKTAAQAAAVDKAKENAEYLAKLDRSFAEYERGFGKIRPLVKNTDK